MKKLTLFFCFSLLLKGVSAQMWNGQDTLFGNEWIDYNAQYFKIKVASDGVYRILGSALEAQNIPLNVPSAGFRLYRNGKEVPMYASTEGIFTNTDYLEFFGRKNRHEIDQHLFTGGEPEMGNPDYALFNDTSAYYLTFSQVGTPLRYTNLPNDLTNAPPKETYCLYNLVHNAPGSLRKVNISNYITHTWFKGDSWGPAYAKTYGTSFTLPGLAANGPNVKLQTRYLTDYGNHRVEYRINDSLFHTNNVSESKIHFANFVASPTFFANNTVNIAFLDTIEATSRIGYGMTNVEYPRTWDLGNASYFKFSVEASNVVKYVEASSFNLAGGNVTIYDLSNNTRLTATVEGGLVKFVLPPSASKREIVMVNAGSAAVSVSPVLSPMVDLRNSNADYIIISHPVLRLDASTGLDYVQEFADYRASMAGGSHTPIIVDINQLYEQFAYGNAFNPISIRNFAHFVKKNWAQPKKVFLIGKGLEYNLFRSSGQQAQYTNNHLFNIPVFGYPGADIPYFTANKPGKPILACGRLAVVNTSDIKAYLEKVKEYELNFHLPQTLEDKGWIKRALHLSGAPSAKGLLSQMEQVAKNNKLGYDVSYFEVTTNDPIQVSNVKKIQNLFKEGVSIMSYLGHSAAGNIGFDIGSINEYENKGKYPFFAVFGCFTGLCSAPEKNLGERFVLAPEKGSIGYMASTYFSFDNSIGLYGRRFYEMSGGIGYHQSIAENIANTVGSFDNPDASMSAINQQMHFQGDPAIQLYNFDGADYIIDHNSVSFQPNPVSVETDSFQVKFDVVNIGEGLDSNFVVTIDRTPPNDTLRNVLTTTIAAPKNRATLTYKLPTSESRFIGFNRMNITVDKNNNIPELPNPTAELNNRLLDISNQPGVDLYFFNNDVSIVYPTNFSIIPKDSVTLSASTLSNVNNLPLKYIFQIDTSAQFDSPIFKSKTYEQNGGLLQWKPELALLDSTVYYWRVTRDSLANGDLPWKTHSFVHIKDSPLGWHQSHFYQYTQDSLRFFRADTLSRKLQFTNNATRITVKAGYRGTDTRPGINNSYNEGYDFNWQWSWDQLANLNTGAVVFAILNPNNGRFVMNPLGSPTNPSLANPIPFFVFKVADSLQRVAMMDFMQNTIPDQSRVIVYGHTDNLGSWSLKPELWAADSITYGTNIYRLFEAQGSTQLRQMSTSGTAAFGVIYKKNDPSVPMQEIVNYDKTIGPSLTDEFLVNWVSGTLTTTKIGPASEWGGVYWNTELPDNGTDTISLSVYGIKTDNTEEKLMELPHGITEASLTQISAALYPYLRLEYFNEDTTNNTATHPSFFRVTYEPIPEGAVDPLTDFVFFKDTLDQGQNMHGQLVFKNVSLSKMDSVLVNYRIENSGGTGSETLTLHKPLSPGDTLRANITLNTAALTGDQRLIFDVNPNNHQPELHHFNNVYFKSFFVREDQIPPLLDVTFDGVHILNGDLVSPKPEIIMTLNDENKYLALNDTADFRVYLKYPDGSEQRIYFTNPDLLFFPADAANLNKKNKAKLEFRPYLLEDGEYKLRVNASDVTNNIAGRVDYEVAFKVINKSALSNIMNYPNPFSTSTCFVYTMTGLEQPATLRIRILTVAGRVVREIDGNQFGIMRAGTHLSDYCWDGKDEYGDQLANGVYYYQVIAKKANGEAFDLFENAKADGFFKNGYGKMVLMR